MVSRQLFYCKSYYDKDEYKGGRSNSYFFGDVSQLRMKALSQWSAIESVPGDKRDLVGKNWRRSGVWKRRKGSEESLLVPPSFSLPDWTCSMLSIVDVFFFFELIKNLQQAMVMSKHNLFLQPWIKHFWVGSIIYFVNTFPKHVLAISNIVSKYCEETVEWFHLEKDWQVTELSLSYYF